MNAVQHNDTVAATLEIHRDLFKETWDLELMCLFLIIAGHRPLNQ